MKTKQASKKSHTAIVILNWNGKKFLAQFLPSVITHSAEAEVIVADNASDDDSVAFMRENYPDIRLIVNQSNKGYAGGYNEALKQIDASYYVLLNSDIEVSEGWLSPLVALMDSDERIAACQPTLRSFHQRDTFEYAGAAGGFIDRMGYPFCRGRIFDHLEKDEGQYDEVSEVFWATGACLMVRASAFWEAGGFDEDFFAHMEEVDLCWRLKQQGYKIMVQPASKVFHVGGGTLPKNSPFKTYLNFRNNFSLLYKNLPAQKLWPVLLTRLIWDGVAGIKFLLEGHWKDSLAIMKGHFYFYSHVGKLKEKRRKIKPGPVSGVYKKNIALRHFIYGVKKFSELSKQDFTKG